MSTQSQGWWARLPKCVPWNTSYEDGTMGSTAQRRPPKIHNVHYLMKGCEKSCNKNTKNYENLLKLI